MDTTTVAPPVKRGNVFGGGWWIVLLAVLFTLAAGAEMVVKTGLFKRQGERKPWNGFAINNLTVPADVMVAPIGKDSMPFRLEPKMVGAEEAEAWTAGEHHKFLVSGERVIGVDLNGQARCYPLRLMWWNEVVNDAAGGTPIAVTYNPLCDSTVVFDRRVSGETLAFGTSGLLYNSNLVMYDRRTGPDGKEDQSQESLWSQLGFRAIAGKEEGRGLAVLPCVVTTWGRWRSLHPDTLVLARDPQRKELEDNGTYGTYFNTDALAYPVKPEWSDPQVLKKTRLVVVGANGGSRGGQWFPVQLPKLAGLTGPNGRTTLDTPAGAITLAYRQDGPEDATVTASDATGKAVPTVYSFVFAWYAIQGPLTR